MQLWNACTLNLMNEYAKRGALFILSEKLEGSISSIKVDSFILNSTTYIESHLKEYIDLSFGCI